MKTKKDIYFIIILIVALIDIIYGFIFQINKSNYFDNLISIDANIHQITKTNNTDTLYLDYNIDEEIHNTVILTKNKNNKVGKNITIYCEKENLTNCIIEKTSYSGFYIILLGIIILIIDFKYYYKNINIKLNK